jgi:hypothetical protein
MVMAWYLAPALAVGRSEVNRRWPNRDKASDGTIGDAAHQASTSDHNPNARESVNAWDMDKDGVDVWAVIDAFQRHPSSHYWIFNRQIADRDDGWRRRAYSGDNPHTAHVHFSIRQTAAAEQDQRPWGIWPVPEEDDMFQPDDKARLRNVEAYLHALFAGRDATGLDAGGGKTVTVPNLVAQRLTAIVAAAGVDQADEAAIVAGVLAGLTPEVLGAAIRAAGLTPEALAAMVPVEMRKQVADELAGRLAA